MAFGNAHQDTDGCTWPERNKKMQVRRPWHSGMLTRTWMDAPGQKEIKKCRSVSHSIQECSLGHRWMHLAGKKLKKAGPSAMAFGNAHQDTDGCIWLERYKKMQVCRQWDSGMLIGKWMDAPAWKKIKKRRSVGNG